jgi:hypothetical protein
MNQALAHLQSLVDSNRLYDQNVIHVYLSPIFARGTSSSTESAYAAMSTAPTSTRTTPAMETAFYARPDPRLPPRQQYPPPDNRPRSTGPDRRVVTAPDGRRESWGPSVERHGGRESSEQGRLRDARRAAREERPGRRRSANNVIKNVSTKQPRKSCARKNTFPTSRRSLPRCNVPTGLMT